MTCYTHRFLNSATVSALRTISNHASYGWFSSSPRCSPVSGGFLSISSEPCSWNRPGLAAAQGGRPSPAGSSALQGRKSDVLSYVWSVKRELIKLNLKNHTIYSNSKYSNLIKFQNKKKTWKKYKNFKPLRLRTIIFLNCKNIKFSNFQISNF